MVKNFVGAQKFGNWNGKKSNRIILNRKKEKYLNSKPQVVPTKIADLEQHMALFKLGELKLSVCLLALFKNHWQIRVAVLGYHISVCKMNTTWCFQSTVNTRIVTERLALWKLNFVDGFSRENVIFRGALDQNVWDGQTKTWT